MADVDSKTHDPVKTSLHDVAWLAKLDLAPDWGIVKIRLSPVRFSQIPGPPQVSADKSAEKCLNPRNPFHCYSPLLIYSRRTPA